jgi:hypothetical protein
MNQLRPVEQALVNAVLAALTKSMGFTNAKIVSIERKSDKDYDVKFEGTSDFANFAMWLPLGAIRELVQWTSPNVARMSDYPEMVMEGDWSGIRDSSSEKIWAIFNEHVIEESLRRGLVRSKT